MPAPAIEFQQGGVLLPKLGLWLDSHLPQPGREKVFISHAHSDHTALHREVILSAPTARLMHARGVSARIEHQLLFGEACSFQGIDGSYNITLLPAGHIFGSAMAFIESEGQSLLYTGDFKLRRGLSAEPCEPRRADFLIMETTYGRQQYRFPPTDEVIAGIIRFCREALDNDETAVLLGYSLGKSQELLCSLGDAGLPIMLHGAVHKLTQVYEQFGHCFPKYERYEAGQAQGRVLLCPPNVAGSPMLRKLGRARVAVITGWAVEPSCRYRYGADAAFPLSDHADFDDLIELVKQVQPRKVFTLHGFAAEFAQCLRELGFDAETLSEHDQMGLQLQDRPRPSSSCSVESVESRTRTKDEDEDEQQTPSAFVRLANACLAISLTSSKLAKTQLLADYLRSIDAPLTGTVVTWFSGTPFAATENKIMQLGWALQRDAICEVSGVTDSDFHQVFLKHSDLGETAFELFSHRPIVVPFLSIESVSAAFEKFHAARGALAKLPLLTQVLEQCSPIEAKFLVKILTSDLRIGLKEGLVEEAVALAFNVSPEQVRQANLLLGNVGETAQLARENRLAEAALVPLRPVKFMLASPEPTAAAIWKRFEALEREDRVVRLEDKYDGIRCQLHKVGQRVALYSRDLKDITATFPELADAARQISHDVILDGEILAMRGDEVLPFAHLQRRLGRREPDLFLREEFPIKYVTFDLLWQNDHTLLDQPLEKRWEALLALQPFPQFFQLVHVTLARSSEEIDAAFATARARNNEGLMIKDPHSAYTPGRRGLAWLKLKMAFDTLDCVVVGAEYGHGKRRNVLSDYTFAVRDENSGQLKTIGKAYSGLTDAEIAELTDHFLNRVVQQYGRYHEVVPDTVLEIAFDRLQSSTRHSSGLAMRFPRILRIRRDKTPDQIDTLQSAQRLVRSSRGDGK